MADPVVLGRIVVGAVNSLYLHSSTLSPSDSMGPSRGATECICKLNVTSAAGEAIFQSTFRPHRYCRVPPTTITRLDFQIKDCQGKEVDLQGSKVSFVLTIHNEAE